MGKSKIILILFFFVFSVPFASAQINRYVVYFTDKDGSEYTIDNPEAYLSQRAIDRRQKYGIPVRVQDLPVNTSYIESIENIEGITVYYPSKWFNALLVEADVSVLPAIEDLSFVSEIILAAPGQRLGRVGEVTGHSDVWIDQNARKKELSNAIQNNMLGVDEMHAEGFTGKGIMIAVFDAGFVGMNVSPYFTRLYNNDLLKATWNFVQNNEDVYQYDDHGTSVLSTISGYSENTYSGIAHDAEVVLCITEDVPTEYVIEEYNWLFAAEFADSIGVDIINTSLGYNTFDDPNMDYTYQDLDGNTAVITRATDIAASKGILCVVSAGNEGRRSWMKIVAPADADSVLSVGAVDQYEEYLTFSSSGPTADERIKPEVGALGQGTVIVGWDGQLTSGSGTSYASPLIAGLAAGVWQAYPELNNIEILELIKKGSSQYDAPDTLLGFGIPDFRVIQNQITALNDDITDKGIKVYPNPVKNRILFVEIPDNVTDRSIVTIDIIDVRGTSIFQLVSHRKNRVERLELDLQHLSSGVYLLQVETGDIAASARILVP